MAALLTALPHLRLDVGRETSRYPPLWDFRATTRGHFQITGSIPGLAAILGLNFFASVMKSRKESVGQSRKDTWAGMGWSRKPCNQGLL